MKTKNILSTFIFCFLFSVIISSCTKSGTSAGNTTGGTGGAGGGGLSVTVDMNGMSFSPSTTTVKIGTTVKWTNSDYYSAHTATSNDGTTFNSGNMNTGSSYSFIPNVAGTFPYHCNIHGAAMSGTLVVTN